MSWIQTDAAPAGKYIRVAMKNGWYVDLFGSYSETEVLERIREYADGWQPLQVVWNRGFFGIGDTLTIFGRATNNVYSEVVRNQTVNAVNSFIGIGGSDGTVTFSDDIAAPAPEGEGEWTGTIQLIAVAVIAVAIVYGIKQVREIAK